MLIQDLLRLNNAMRQHARAQTSLNEFDANSLVRNRMRYIQRKYDIDPVIIVHMINALRKPVPVPAQVYKLTTRPKRH